MAIKDEDDPKLLWRVGQICAFVNTMVNLGRRVAISGDDIVISLRAMIWLAEELKRQPNIEPNFLSLATSEFILAEIKKHDSTDDKPDQRRH